MATSLIRISSGFGIPTPPILEPIDVKSPFFHPKEDEYPQLSANVTEASSPEPTTPTSPGIRSFKSRYLITDSSMLPELLPMIAKAHNIKTPASYDSLSNAPCETASAFSSSSSSPPSPPPSSSSSSPSKRKRKGTPHRSPNRGDFEADPGMVFRFPVVFSDSSAPNTPVITISAESDSGSNKPTNSHAEDTTTQATKVAEASPVDKKDSKPSLAPSATIIHRPVLLPDVVRKINQVRRSRIRARPVTRAKNKRGDEFSLFYSGLDLLSAAINADNTNGHGNSQIIENDTLSSTFKRPNTATTTMSSPSLSSTSATSQGKYLTTQPRGSHMNRPSTVYKQSARSTAQSSPSSFYFNISGKRRTSLSISSLSSVPTSDLSDLDDVNTDNYGDDEDDPDFTPSAKHVKLAHGSGLGITVQPTSSHPRERKESHNHRAKICASCRTKSTPCWRPGWRPELFLCNSCGLRYKKTKCVCLNPECRYIPLKSEYNAMFKKPKNGEISEAKRCCKCHTEL